MERERAVGTGQWIRGASHVNAPDGKLLSGAGTCFQKDLVGRRESGCSKGLSKKISLHHHTQGVFSWHQMCRKNVARGF